MFYGHTSHDPSSLCPQLHCHRYSIPYTLRPSSDMNQQRTTNNSEKATPIHLYMCPLSHTLRPSSDMNQQRTTIYVPPLI